MKRDKIIYRIATGIVCTVMLYSIISFTFFETALYPDGAFNHMHLPPYFKIELTIAKALGLAALLIPAVPYKVKEFAYFGFAITLASAAIAHFSVGDGFFYVIDPLIFLCILVVSYFYFVKLNKQSLLAIL